MINTQLAGSGTTGNPIITHKFTADPTALVFDNTVYLYTGHDEAPKDANAYVMNDWLCFASKDMANWKEYPSPLKATGFSWARGDAYASKVIYHNSRFFWFAPVSHAEVAGKAIGVAMAALPEGPFEDAIGAALITHDLLPEVKNDKANLDPSVLIDRDGTPHLFWGNGLCYHCRLKSNLLEVDGPIRIISLPGFAEGVHIHQRDDWYYLSYGYGSPEKVAYAMSRNIEGTWEFKGILNEVAGNCETNRPCILTFKGTDYFIYHNGALPGGGSHRRSVCIDYLYYNADGTMRPVIMTSEGVSRV